MSQINPGKFQIKVMSGMVASPTWVPVVVPSGMSRCHRVVVFNVDGSVSMSLCTDTADANSVVAIAAGKSLEIALNIQLAGFGPNAIICYVQGAGAQPLIHYYE